MKIFTLPRLLISGASRSVGKTTLTIGLIDALRRERGLSIQPFKKGPDFIDPMWTSKAAGRECRSLDFHMLGAREILNSLRLRSTGADLALIEGNQGLHDGLDEDGGDSSAALAKLTRSPVLFALDAARMNRGVGALLSGFVNFDPEVEFAGVILNRVSSARHESKARAAIEKYVGLEIFGAIPKLDETTFIHERRMGLVALKEAPELAERIERIGAIVAENVDLDRIVQAAQSAAPIGIDAQAPEVKPRRSASKVNIGVAMDEAFNFYYPENLETLEAAGARLKFFSPLRSKSLPENIRALYIGGGLPEYLMDQLESNHSIRAQIRERAQAGLPILAECGGLIYLTRKIVWNERSAEMVGALDAVSVMTKSPIGIGYMRLEPIAANRVGWAQNALRSPANCHEFHYSYLDSIPGDARFAWRVARGIGIKEKMDGWIHNGILASFAHFHRGSADGLFESLVEAARAIARKRALKTI